MTQLVPEDLEERPLFSEATTSKDATQKQASAKEASQSKRVRTLKNLENMENNGMIKFMLKCLMSNVFSLIKI